MANAMKIRAVDRLVAAATLMGEARGEHYQGKVAVAWVIRNRASVAKWWGLFSAKDRQERGVDAPRYSVEAVCLKRMQFSCWNKNDPSYPTCERFSDPNKFEDNLLNSEFSDCLRAVDEVFSGKIEDPTFGATHYINPKIADPKWDDGVKATATIGAHRFYTGIK